MTADEVLLKKPTPKPPPREPVAPLTKVPGPLTRIVNWYNKSRIVPYATVKDLNQTGGGEPEDLGKVPATEIGIRIRF